MAMQKIVITGGAGFIGSNLAHQLLGQGHNVTIYDNLSRPGCQKNLAWLRANHDDDGLQFIKADVTDYPELCKASEGAQRIYHLAGQVAVTSSITSPRDDFEANALGTFNALEAARLYGDDPIFIYSSTNKVYGSLEHIPVVEEENAYRFASMACGVAETEPLDFHSPYGCSKGAGDQYVRDYARIYGLRTIVARQSCIYGYRQLGVEDQGWVAWFIIAALKDKPITIYGNGKQVRDVLFIDDLLSFYEAAVHHIEVSAGKVYNVGGGPENTLSIWAEFGSLLKELLQQPIDVDFADWRPGDQRIFVSDIQKAARELGWRPRISVGEGVGKLVAWIQDNDSLFDNF